MATPGRLTPEQVDAALKKGGLDPAKLNAAYKADSKRINAILERNMDRGEAFNFGGTLLCHRHQALWRCHERAGTDRSDQGSSKVLN